MKFILREVKLWFDKEGVSPKSYQFEPNKINVITGDSTVGKTSFWNIIDYCLLSSRLTIPTEIIDRVKWFGIRFSLNEKEIAIARKSPKDGVISKEIYFNEGDFPDRLVGNKAIHEVKSLLDTEFEITEELRLSHNRKYFDLSYRHFLIFNALTQKIIADNDSYFDTHFYGNEEYTEILDYIFELAIGISDIDSAKLQEQLKDIEKNIKEIENKAKSNEKTTKKFDEKINYLIQKSKESEIIEYNTEFTDIDDKVATIDKIVSETIKRVENESLPLEIKKLNEEKKKIQIKIHSITLYKNELKKYKNNLEKSADSLKPIEFLKKHLSEQLLDSYESKTFLELLEESLLKIKKDIRRNTLKEPPKVQTNEKELRAKLKEIQEKIAELEKIKNNNSLGKKRYFAMGEIKTLFKQTLELKDKIKPIDTVRLHQLIESKNELLEKNKNIPQRRIDQIGLLNKNIENQLNRLESLKQYRNGSVSFDMKQKILKITPNGQLFPILNIGSNSNYMLLHLCFYLGIHRHIMNLKEKNILPFIFIDQPSTPYFGGENKDKDKLLDAFSLLNSFMNEVLEIGDFQIFMIEHASKTFWEGKFENFHTVDEFIKGKGLIPSEAYKK